MMEKPTMAKHMGIWLDHAIARIATMDGETPPLFVRIESGVESQHRSFGQTGTGVPGNIGGNPERHYQNRRENELRRYYDRVIHAMQPAQHVVVMGPGEAKTELRRELERHPQVASKVVAFEPADKLTDAEFIARTRQAMQAMPRPKPARL
jgi:stalled ribosome rescue protein Dom34